MISPLLFRVLAGIVALCIGILCWQRTRIQSLRAELRCAESQRDYLVKWIQEITIKEQENAETKPLPSFAGYGDRSGRYAQGQYGSYAPGLRGGEPGHDNDGGGNGAAHCG